MRILTYFLFSLVVLGLVYTTIILLHDGIQAIRESRQQRQQERMLEAGIKAGVLSPNDARRWKNAHPYSR